MWLIVLSTLLLLRYSIFNNNVCQGGGDRGAYRRVVVVTSSFLVQPARVQWPQHQLCGVFANCASIVRFRVVLQAEPPAGRVPGLGEEEVLPQQGRPQVHRRCLRGARDEPVHLRPVLPHQPLRGVPRCWGVIQLFICVFALSLQRMMDNEWLGVCRIVRMLML